MENADHGPTFASICEFLEVNNNGQEEFQIISDNRSYRFCTSFIEPCSNSKELDIFWFWTPVFYYNMLKLY
ncbi:MAG: hypothetical protein WCB31_06710 [Nitrososphaeraceae archaeon]